MKILLRSDVEKIGQKGDIKEVKDGYARNYLIPRGLALKANKGVELQAASMRKSREIRDAKGRDEARELADKLEAVTFTINVQVGGEGKMFGAVTPADIISAVDKQLSIAVDRHSIHLSEPIKSLGNHEVGVQLHPDVVAKLKLDVVGQQGSDPAKK